MYTKKGLWTARLDWKECSIILLQSKNLNIIYKCVCVFLFYKVYLFVSKKDDLIIKDVSLGYLSISWKKNPLNKADVIFQILLYLYIVLIWLSAVVNLKMYLPISNLRIIIYEFFNLILEIVWCILSISVCSNYHFKVKTSNRFILL